MNHLPVLGKRLVGVMLDRVRDLTVAEQQHENDQNQYFALDQ